MKRVLLLLCSVLISSLAFATLPTGHVPPDVTLQGDAGGRLDGTAWKSAEIGDKIYIMFYVDPDESDLNNDLSDTLKKEEFPKDQFASIAIINMDATWKPNAIIASVLEGKQEEFPNTIYVKDMKKLLVEKWGLDDDNSDIILFDKEGSVIFSVDGKLTKDQINEVIQLIKEHI